MVAIHGEDAVLVVLSIGITGLLAATVYQNYQKFHKPLLTTHYQAVTLENGNTFYGRIDHLGSDHPVLRNVFTVRAEIDAQTQQSRYVLVKRKDEINGADHKILPIRRSPSSNRSRQTRLSAGSSNAPAADN